MLLKEKFVLALSKGTKEDAETVYDYIEKFANYGFNKSHAVAYAMLSYQLACPRQISNGISLRLYSRTRARNQQLQDYLVVCQLGIKILPQVSIVVLQTLWQTIVESLLGLIILRGFVVTLWKVS